MARMQVPGGLALGTFFALATGVVTWLVLEHMFPPLARTVRGIPNGLLGRAAGTTPTIQA